MVGDGGTGGNGGIGGVNAGLGSAGGQGGAGGNAGFLSATAVLAAPADLQRRTFCRCSRRWRR